MFKFIKAFFRGLYKILLAYPKIRKYAKNKDKYPIEERYAFARKLINILMKSFEVKLNVEGLEKLDMSDAFMIVCNHQGVMDALTMVYLFDKPLACVSKIEARKYPIVGKVVYFIDSIFIDRENVRDAVKMVRSCKEYLNSGRSVVIFPEGTRTKDENYMPGEYKAGAFKPSYETKKKTVVMAIDGGYKVFSKKYKGKLSINVKVLEVIEPSVYDNKNTTEIAKFVEEKTSEALIEMRKQ